MDKYVVRKTYSDSATQSNTFNNLSYAIRESDKYPKYNVYESDTGKLVHESTNKDLYVVRKSYNDLKSQTNTFNNLNNATKESDRFPGYNVYESQSEKLIHESTNKDKYVVRASFDNLASQTNTFSNLENAKKEAKKYPCYSVYDLSGACLFTSGSSKVDTFIAKLVEFDKILRQDIKSGIRWYYSNSGIQSTFAKARSSKKYRTNCVSGVQWAMLASGVVGTTREAIQWYGGKGDIVWVGTNAEKNAKKYFKITKVGNKTVKQCIADGTIQRGDIITYVTMNHTNVYLGDNTSFDCGHAYCKGDDFTKWIGNLTYPNQKVGCVLRLK